MLNKICIVGRLVDKPEDHYATGGIYNVRMCVANTFNKRDVNYFNAICFGDLAKSVMEHGFKGQLVAIAGKMSLSRRESRKGEKYLWGEIVMDSIDFLEWKDEEDPIEKALKEKEESKKKEVLEDDNCPF